jgi:GDPmannose 4,6-dehydratase
MSGKVAFITGITGQDGSFLAELLLENGYTVHGLIRRSSNNDNLKRIWHIHDNPNLFLHYGDLMDQSCLVQLFKTTRPHEIYNLAAQSHVKVSFEVPDYTVMTSGVGVLKVLEAIRQSDLVEHSRIYQAGSSEMYGDVLEKPQKESTPFNPQSPYACAKMMGHYLVKNYRESYGMYAVSGILFNHESERRGFNFVTRKITNWVNEYHKNKDCSPLQLGNLDSKRDWGYAKDYVKAMWLMLQQTGELKDYVVATGVQYTVRDFVEKALRFYGYDIVWSGSGDTEIGKTCTGVTIVEVNKKYYRPNEVEDLLGDPTLAIAELGWEPETNLDQLIEVMLTKG